MADQLAKKSITNMKINTYTEIEKISIGIVALSFLPVVGVLFLFFDVSVWRHDSAYYYSDYIVKLKSEGRWIVYFIFDVIKLVNPYASIITHLICLGIFIYNASERVCQDKIYSFSIVSLCLMAIPLYSQLLWPVTTLPAFLIIAVAPYVSRVLSIRVFFIVFGILLFGTMSYLYFILILLYTNVLLDIQNENFLFKVKVLVVDLLLPWVSGFLIGYLVAILFVYLVSGEVGIKLDEWRMPNPIHDLSSFLLNTHKAYFTFNEHIKSIIDIVGSRAAVFSACLSIFCYFKKRKFFI